MTEPLKPSRAADRAAIPLRDAAAARERGWWRRVPACCGRRARCSSPCARTTRRTSWREPKPVLALVILAGIGAILLTPEWGSLLDDWRIDTTVAAVFTFLGGGMYGAAGYFLLGLVVYVGARGMGGELSFRQSRQAIAFAAAPARALRPDRDPGDRAPRRRGLLPRVPARHGRDRDPGDRGRFRSLGGGARRRRAPDHASPRVARGRRSGAARQPWWSRRSRCYRACCSSSVCSNSASSSSGIAYVWTSSGKRRSRTSSTYAASAVAIWSARSA